MQETASTADSLGSLQVKYKISRSLFRPASSERRSEFEIDYNIHLYNRTIPIQEFETFLVQGFQKISILESPVSGFWYLESGFWWHLYLLDNIGTRSFLWRAGGIFNLENDVFFIFRDYTNTPLRECGFYVARARSVR